MAKTPNKRQIIVVGINSLISTTQSAYSNHIQLFYQLGRQYPDIDICLVNPPRMSIDRMRNTAAETALSIGASHLLFIDDDVLIPRPFDFLRKLLACKAPIAAGNVYIRGYPFNHMFFKYTPNKDGLVPVAELPKNHKPGIFDVDAVGFSCCLIETDLLRKLNKPYFVTGLTNTEDIYFCLEARRKDPNCRIVVDTSIECAHILWNEFIETGNRKHYKRYYEAMYGKPKPEKHDRGLAYYRMVKSLVQQEDEKA